MDNNNSEIKCLRCGKCCHHIDNGQIKKCKFLIKLPNGKTLCRVYSTRLGRILGKTSEGKYVKCGERSCAAHDFVGCPYNTNKPLFPERFK